MSELSPKGLPGVYTNTIIPDILFTDNGQNGETSKTPSWSDDLSDLEQRELLDKTREIHETLHGEWMLNRSLKVDEIHAMLSELSETVTMVRSIIARAPQAANDAPPMIRPLIKMLFPE